MKSSPFVVAILVTLVGCAAQDASGGGDAEDGEFDQAGGKSDSVVEGSAQAAGILYLVNDAMTTVDTLDNTVGLSSRVARNIIAYRDGGNPFDTIAELDAIPFVGPVVMQTLLEYATAQGYVFDEDYGFPITWAFLSFKDGQVPCPAGVDTIALHSQREGSMDLTVDLFDCSAGRAQAPLPFGVHTVWLEAMTSTMEVYATTPRETITNIPGNGYNPIFLTDGGYFEMAWTLRDPENAPLTCAEVADLDAIDMAITFAGTTEVIVEKFSCANGKGRTDILEQGDYVISMSAINASEQALGAPQTRTGTIGVRNAITNLGSFVLPID